MYFPEIHSNVLEMENRELRRRADEVGICPGRASVLRVLDSLLLDPSTPPNA